MSQNQNIQKHVYIYIYTWVVYEYACMSLIIREYTHIRVMEMCILTYCTYVQYIYIYIHKLTSTNVIYLKTWSYVIHLYLMSHIYIHISIHDYIKLYIYIYTNAYYRTCMSHPNNQPNRLTVDFWSHSGWAPRTWIFFKKIRLERLINIFISVSIHKFQKGSPKPPVFKNHRDCSPCLH